MLEPLSRPGLLVLVLTLLGGCTPERRPISSPCEGSCGGEGGDDQAPGGGGKSTTGGQNGSVAGFSVGGAGDAGEGGALGDGAAGEPTAPDSSEGGSPGMMECSASEYAKGSDCIPLTVCGPDEYEATPPQPDRDRVCKPVAKCGQDEYQSAPAQSGMNAVCSAVSQCSPGYRESAAPTASTDRKCAPCDSGTFSAMFNASACTTWKTCGVGETESVAPSSTNDRVCSACGAGKYSKNGTCTNLTVCSATQYESKAPTASTDRECMTVSTCQPGSQQTAAPTDTSDRLCAPCGGGSFSSTQNATKCTSFTACTATEYESSAPTSIKDRGCTALTNCSAGKYISTAATATSDRKCTACASSTFSDTQNATKCNPWTVCTWSETVANSGTPTSDTTCKTGSDFRYLDPSAKSEARGLAIDGSGNVLVVGCTTGALSGNNAGGTDAFVQQYDVNGNAGWKTQFGTADNDCANGVATDAQGRVYVVGVIGSASLGKQAFLRKFDNKGAAVGSPIEIGAPTQKLDDLANAVTLDASGNVYVTGNAMGGLDGTANVGPVGWIRKYTSAGAESWTKQIGAGGEEPWNVIILKDGSPLVGGRAAGNLGLPAKGWIDGFLRKFNTSSGASTWTDEFGTDLASYTHQSVEDASGNIYTCGNSAPASTGTYTGFIQKHNSSGVPQWYTQLQESEIHSNACIGEAAGTLLLGGYLTVGGSDDACIARYSSSGLYQSTVKQFGNAARDWISALAYSSDGKLYAIGGNDGNTSGGQDTNNFNAGSPFVLLVR
jgi:hypothetical protein